MNNLTGGAPNMRGLPVPTRKVRHNPQRRESSAPPFLRRTVEEMEALDKGRQTVERVVKPRQARTIAPVTGPRPQPHVDVRQLAADYTSGMNLRTAGQRHGLGEIRTARLLKAAGVTIRPQGGVRLSNVKLDIDEAERLYADGASLRSLAEKYRTDRNKISDLLRARGVTIRPAGYHRAAS